VPVFSSFGGGTESSKLYAGAVVVVVGPSRTVVVETAEPEAPGTEEFVGAAAFEPPLHAAKPTAAAIKTPVPHFPTSRRVSNVAQHRKVTRRSVWRVAQIHVAAIRSTNRHDGADSVVLRAPECGHNSPGIRAGRRHHPSARRYTPQVLP